MRVTKYGLPLTEGVDYRLNYLKNAEAGTGYVLVQGIGSPYDLNMEEGEIKRRIAKSVQAEYPNYFCVATLERSYVSGKK